MRDPQINRVWRRLWRAFLRAGGEASDRQAVERFRRLVEDHVNVMPPALARAMVRVLAASEEPNYARLARNLSEVEGIVIGTAAACQRVSRAVRRLEQIIRAERWAPASAPERIAIVFQPTRTPRGRPVRAKGTASLRIGAASAVQDAHKGP